MRATAWCAAAAVLLLGAPPALAQDARPTRGGGGFNDAPRLKPGTYSDSIRIGETLHYAVPVGPGQQLTARGRLALRTRGPADSFVLDGQLYGSLRGEEDPQDITTQQDQSNRSGPMTVELTSSPAGEGTERPGVHYFTLDFDNLAFEKRPSKRQFPLVVDVEVTGAGAGGSGEPSVTAGDGPPPADQREALAPSPARPEPGDGSPPGSGAADRGPGGFGLGLGGLVGGLVLGAAAMAARRRSRAAES